MYALVVVLAWYVSGGRTAPSPVASSSSSSPVVLAPSPTFCARRDPIVCAHGTVGSADWPRSMGRRPFPNTVPALAAAVAAGHECVEVDASRTKDDHLVALHPRELKMLTGGRVGNPGDLTLAEIMSLTMPGAKEYRVATFAEAMAVVMNKGLTQITVDFKDGPPRREEGFASAVTREIARLGRSHGSGRSQSATTACPECVYWGKSDEIALDVLELTRGDAKARSSSVRRWLVSLRRRSRGERRSLLIRTFASVSLRPSHGFVQSRHASMPFNSASDAFRLHPDVAAYAPYPRPPQGWILGGQLLEGDHRRGAPSARGARGRDVARVRRRRAERDGVRGAHRGGRGGDGGGRGARKDADVRVDGERSGGDGGGRQRRRGRRGDG
jgi:hypothetical protein